MDVLSEAYIQEMRFSSALSDDDHAVWPFSLPAIRDLEKLKFNKSVTFIVGENGMGKSTLLEALALLAGFNPEGGTQNFNFSTKDTHSGLHERLTLVRGFRRPRDGFFLRAESFYNVASAIDELDSIPAFSPKISDSYGGKSLHNQSHGESFMALALNRFGGNGLYILDEPEAALSPTRQMSLLCRIDQLVRLSSQFIIATHSPIIMAYPGADIYVLDESGVTLTSYRDTDHYIVTRRFLNNTETMLGELLGHL